MERIKGIVDINPKKQKHFVPTTGKLIYAPENVTCTDTVIVMNPNYIGEIRKMTSAKCYSIEEFISC